MTDLTDAELDFLARVYSQRPMAARLVAEHRALRARVAEGTGGAGQVEPVAWGATDEVGSLYFAHTDLDEVETHAEETGGTVVPLFRAPGAVSAAPPADEDQAAVERADEVIVKRADLARVLPSPDRRALNGDTYSAAVRLRVALAAARAPGSPRFELPETERG